MDFSLTSSLYM